MSRQLAMYRAGSRVASSLPERSAYSLAETVGRAVGRLPDVDRRRALVASHLERVMGRRLCGPERRRLVGDVFANYGRYWAESLRLPSVPHDAVVAGTATIGFEHLEGALAQRKGVIIVAPHLGGWEWAAFYLTGNGLPMTVAVEPLRPPDLFNWFAHFRQRLGMQVVPVGPQAAGTILRALQDNHIVCLLADRLVGESTGVEVEFFGALTAQPAGPVTLAMRSGAALMTAAVYYDRPEASHTIVFRAPLDIAGLVPVGPGAFRAAVRKGAQMVAYELEELIRPAPTQWHLVQPNWPDDPPLRSRRHLRRP